MGARLRKRIQKQLLAKQGMIPSIAPGNEAYTKSGEMLLRGCTHPQVQSMLSLHQNHYLEAVVASTSDAMIML